MLTWLESLTSSRFPIGFCYQKTCDNKWWFSKSLILFCFQTASNFVTVLFFLTTSHLLFSTKSQRAKNVTQLFLPFQFQPFEIIDFLIFPALCFHIKRAKKFGSFFWKHWFNFSRNWCSDLNGTGNAYTKTISFISITKWSLFYLILSRGILCLMEN